MAPMTATDESMETTLLEQVVLPGGSNRPLDERAAILAHLRETSPGIAPKIDGFLLERIARLQDAMSAVEGQQDGLRRLIDDLTAPPYFPAIVLGTMESGQVTGAVVQCGEDRRVVRVSDDVDPDELHPGDEVFLTGERNCLIAKAEQETMQTGEVATYSRALGDGRIVLRSHNEEVVVREKHALHMAGLKAGDGVRFNRTTGLALEKIEASKGDGYFLESTPKESFQDVGGLDGEIEKLKRLLTLHVLHPEIAAMYRLPRRKAVLMEGPPGNGKTKVARATSNWLAGMSPSGRSRFINVKPGQLNSMWYGQTEERYREIFRVAREAADAEPGVPVVMFWDEIDAIGAVRGEAVQRIDDRMLTCFMTELDGLEERGNVVILAATNRLHALDPALARPGRLGDLVLHFPQPKSRAARSILGRHLPADIPYAANGEGTAAAREALLDLAVGRLFRQSPETELARLMLRDGKHRLVHAADLVSGAQLEAIAQASMERACVREAEGGPRGVCAADVDAAVDGFLFAAPRALTPRNARNYLRDLPDVDVVSIDLVERRVTHPTRYRVEVA